MYKSNTSFSDVLYCLEYVAYESAAITVIVEPATDRVASVLSIQSSQYATVNFMIYARKNYFE